MRRVTPRHPRPKVAASAIVHAPDAVQPAEVVDISPGGALLSLDREDTFIASGARVVVTIQFAHGFSAFTVSARAHARGPQRCAIVFEEVPPDIEDVLQDVIVAAIAESQAPRVLVVEPDQDRRRALADHVQTAGCVPVETATPLDVISVLEASPISPSGVVISSTATRDGGTALREHLETERPEIRVSVLDAETAPPQSVLRSRVAPVAVLVVDDDPDVRETMVELLEQAGYAVDSAADGEEALALLRDRPGLYAVVILDFEMPRLDGRGFCEAQLRDPSIARVPVVLASGAPPDNLDGMNVAMVLHKPTSASRLLDAVEACRAH